MIVTDWQHLVRAFNRMAGQTVNGIPQLPSRRDADLFLGKLVPGREGERGDGLLYEELEEMRVAQRERNLPAFVDGIADLVYVALGLANAVGVDLDPIFAAVHQANMAKLGGQKREDGKQMKPEGWAPPDIAAELRKQGWRGGSEE